MRPVWVFITQWCATQAPPMYKIKSKEATFSCLSQTGEGCSFNFKAGIFFAGRGWVKNGQVRVGGRGRRRVGTSPGPFAPPPYNTKSKRGEGRALGPAPAPPGLSFSIINRGPGGEHKWWFRERLPSISTGTVTGTDGNRVFEKIVICSPA